MLRRLFPWALSLGLGLVLNPAPPVRCRFSTQLFPLLVSCFPVSLALCVGRVCGLDIDR